MSWLLAGFQLDFPPCLGCHARHSLGPAGPDPPLLLAVLLPPAPAQVHIEPGHRHGSKVLFRGEAGSDSPDVLPGDLIFILEQVRLGSMDKGAPEEQQGCG